ncbi:hypothetical protein JCM19297_660 [Nonlabens ulvanivorans]|nr:hypothetical protein JCM19297_660 [Nonlabens ulvanivorans]
MTSVSFASEEQLVEDSSICSLNKESVLRVPIRFLFSNKISGLPYK